MEWSERMNAAIDYIEGNLAGEIDINKAAEKAACSSFHFQRMFMVIVGFTPAEYARRRRLTLAARELLSSNAKVIDIALKYGYDSPDSFTRAFRQLHGVTPQAAREPGVTLIAFPRISFSIVLKGGSDMDYRIIEKTAFDVIGKARKFTTEGGENLIKIPQFWDEFIHDENGENVLMELTQGKPGPATGALELGICVGEGVKEGWWESPTLSVGYEGFIYAIGAEKPDKPVPKGFEVFHIPAAYWAIFESFGAMPKAIQDVTVKIFQEWFPSTGYEHDTKPELEVYLRGDPNSKDYRCQVWIPIVKKKK
jgi:AraC family transcriptional regulator